MVTRSAPSPAWLTIGGFTAGASIAEGTEMPAALVAVRLNADTAESQAQVVGPVLPGTMDGAVTRTGAPLVFS